MKQSLCLFILYCCTSMVALAQNLTTQSFTFETKSRQFLLYVPSIYAQANESVPLVIVLHGLGDNMTNMSQVGFHAIADTANFIVATPEALPDPNPLIAMLGNAWNSGAAMFGITPNATLNDSGFLMALVDSVSAQYNIDPNRIYFTGFSMGGYMTNRMACEHSDRVAAIASVAGTIGNSLVCNPERPIPTLHFHGTADGVVAYSNNQSGLDAEELVSFWRDHNQCDTTAIHTALPNSNPSDGYTIDHYEYVGGNLGAETAFYKTTGADHTWLGPNNDLYYTAAIWEFFSQHSRLEGSVGTQNLPHSSTPTWRVYPNPSDAMLYLSLPQQARGMIRLSDVGGQQYFSKNIVQSDMSIDISSLPVGIYILQWQDAQQIYSKKIVVQ